MIIRREGAIRGRVSRGQRQLAGAIGITFRFALSHAAVKRTHFERRDHKLSMREGSEKLAESEVMEVRRRPQPSDFRALWRPAASRAVCGQGLHAVRCFR